MIVIIAQFEFSATARDRVLDITRYMDKNTANEPGCVLYKHSIDVENDNRVFLSEIWTDTEALRAHFASPHFQAFRAAVDGLGIEAKVTQFSGIETAETDSFYWLTLLRESTVH